MDTPERVERRARAAILTDAQRREILARLAQRREELRQELEQLDAQERGHRLALTNLTTH